MTKYWLDENGNVVVATDDTIDGVDGATSYTQTPPISGKDQYVDGAWVRSISKSDIKKEAERRIIEFCPDWKQRNLTVRMVELVDRRRAVPPVITPAEQGEYTELEAVRDHINAIRSASDALELTLPEDYDDDAHWPSAPAIDLDDKF